MRGEAKRIRLGGASLKGWEAKPRLGRGESASKEHIDGTEQRGTREKNPGGIISAFSRCPAWVNSGQGVGMVHFSRIEEGTGAAKGHLQFFFKRRSLGGVAAAVSTALCVASMISLVRNPSSVHNRQVAVPDQRTTQLMEGLGGTGGGGGVDPASLAEFTKFLEGGVKRKTRRDRTVACDGGSSVACVASGAMKGIERDLQRSPDTPGKEAVEVASRGRGFQAWPTRWATAIRSCVKKKALSACWNLCINAFFSTWDEEKTRVSGLAGTPSIVLS